MVLPIVILFIDGSLSSIFPSPYHAKLPRHAQTTHRLPKWKTKIQQDATELGNNSIDGNVTMEETKKNLRNIRKIVSTEVSHADMLTLHSPHTALQTEAGCWIMINAMLLHVAANLDSAGCYCYCASVATRLELTGYTYGGVVDYMIIFTDRSTRGTSDTAALAFKFHLFSRPYCTASEVSLSV